MQLPDIPLSEHLQRAEVEVALVQFAQNSAQIARVLIIAKALASGLNATDGEDLIQSAMMRLLSGQRSWPRGLSTLTLFKNVMRSIASNTRKRDDYQLANDLRDPSYDDADDAPPPIAEGVCHVTDPARMAEGEAEVAAVQQAIKGDEDLELYLEALADGLTGKNIESELGWDERTYDATRKRFTRRVDALKANRSKS